MLENLTIGLQESSSVLPVFFPLNASLAFQVAQWYSENVRNVNSKFAVSIGRAENLKGSPLRNAV